MPTYKLFLSCMAVVIYLFARAQNKHTPCKRPLPRDTPTASRVARRTAASPRRASPEPPWSSMTTSSTARPYLLFPKLFLPQSEPLVATLAVLRQLRRRLRCAPAGRGDLRPLRRQAGRKSILFITLLMMGLATFLIGCLPTFGNVGILAPILPGGAAHHPGPGAPAARPSWSTSSTLKESDADAGRGCPDRRTHRPATGRRHLSRWSPGTVSEGRGASWGWRVPFLLSAVWVGVGFYIT